MNKIFSLKNDLKKLSNPKKAEGFKRFFKTGKNEYGEGDEFLGLNVAQVREVAKKHLQKLTYDDLQKLLQDKIHEYRLCALMILRLQYEKADKEEKKKFVDFYLKNTSHINNWDLVDLSCEYILGNFLLDKKRDILYKLAKSKNLWERRIAIVSTFEFIRHNQFSDTFKISEILLNDKHNLIHKAVGWMLREVGKREEKLLEKFLEKNCQKMPRVMLKYAVEKFEKKKRKKYLNC
ncbi:MAG: DNA alkylation repair protein [Microgenomates group bacterium]|nr:DNA alkylation repair protein [Microgenomates group bacterium]